MTANLTNLPMNDLKRQLEQAFERAHQELLVGGGDLSREELVRLATIMVQTSQLSSTCTMVTGVLATLMDSMATPGAAKNTNNRSN
jgi:CO dehydrogenase/acetyl-CoA synthase epsilon subunit